MTTTTIPAAGADVEVGDVIVFLGDVHRIDRIEPASPATKAMLGDGARFAYAGTWPITLDPTGTFHILPRPSR